jgi:hypothetical protein
VGVRPANAKFFYATIQRLNEKRFTLTIGHGLLIAITNNCPSSFAFQCSSGLSGWFASLFASRQQACLS